MNGPPGSGKTMLTRAVHKIIRVARTIADLSRSEAIESRHLAETMQYQKLSVLQI